MGYPLPMTPAELEALGWDALDVLLVTGDAYVDHPAFGTALIGRVLLDEGYHVGIVSQPQSADDLLVLGRPRLFIGVTAGAIDSMLAHYTAFRKKRGDDAYTPGGKAGVRPNRATLVYANLARQALPGVPVVLGGIEASTRRLSHFDFWSGRLRRSVLLDSKAELLLYGMAESAVVDVARRRSKGETLRGVSGSVFVGDRQDIPEDAEVLQLPSHEEIEAQPSLLLQASLLVERQLQRGDCWAVQQSGGRSIMLAPPSKPLSTEKLDALYTLPFTRRAHPLHAQSVPAEEMTRFSITSHRGCGGGCTFCSLALHQGRRVRSRSAASIIAEAKILAADERFAGSITDVGGPTANMWGSSCRKDPARCERSSCLFPKICKQLDAPQAEIIELLRRVEKIARVRHVRVASGIRHDLALQDERYVEALVQRYTGGQLKIAPEHISDDVLALMRKPPHAVFERFCERFDAHSRAVGKEQYVVPYLLSGFVGCRDADMQQLTSWLQRKRWRPQQIQCFVPTPGTVATAMFFAGVDLQGEQLFVPSSDAERLRQHHALAGKGGSARRGRRGQRGSGQPSASPRRGSRGRRGRGS